jgi:hypothetical protein
MERWGLLRSHREIIRELDHHDAAIPHHAPEHFGARAADVAEPPLQALDAPEDEWPDRQQVPGQARHGGEEGESGHGAHYTPGAGGGG